MQHKTLTIILFVAVSCLPCLGQTSYKGLTPGKSTKMDVQRVLGLPVTKVSDTLIEYRAQPLTSKIYVQFAEDGVVEKIEVRCRLAGSTCETFIKSLGLRLPATPEGEKWPIGDDGTLTSNGRHVFFFGAPLYLGQTVDLQGDDGDVKTTERLSFYSRELYASAVTKAKDEVASAETRAEEAAKKPASESTVRMAGIPAERDTQATEQMVERSTGAPVGQAAGSIVQSIGTSHSVPATPPAAAPAYDDLVKRANAAWDARDGAGAIRLAQQAIAENGSRFEAFQLLGIVQLYGYRDFNSALAAMRAAVERGGTGVFGITHDHDGSFRTYCQGSLWVTKYGVTFNTNTGDGFSVSYAEVAEAKLNGFVGAQAGAFHIKVNQGGKTKNYNFAPGTVQQAESNIILSLIIYH